MTRWRPVVDELVGRFASASNLTVLARAGGRLVVYKPTSGVRALWDFDASSLAVREVLAYEISEAMGLALVPETALGDGPLGPGAVQAYVEEDPGFDVLELLERNDPALWPAAVLDLVVNNADRKAGHLLAEAGTGRLQAIDHGLTFHPDDKLRTVLWGFAGRALPPGLVEALERLEHSLGARLGSRVRRALGPRPEAALRSRVRTLLRHPRHPRPPADRHPVPWPPY